VVKSYFKKDSSLSLSPMGRPSTVMDIVDAGCMEGHDEGARAQTVTLPSPQSGIGVASHWRMV
jgi:hypothetical protein